MFNENNFSDINKKNELPQKNEYTEEQISEKISKNEGLDSDFALYLLDNGKINSLTANLENFNNLSQEIALKLIEVNEGYFVAKFPQNFRGLNQEIALKLIEDGLGYYVARYLANFDNLNYQEIALKLIEDGNGGVVAEFLKNFKINDQEIALKLIEDGLGDFVVKYLQNFSNLNQEIALKLIEIGRGSAVAGYLKDFKNINHQEIVGKLIEAGNGYSVSQFLQSFQGINHQEIALELIKAGKGSSVAEYLRNFQDINDQEIALKLIEIGQGELVAEHSKNFNNLNHEIALKLIEIGQGELVANGLENFKSINHQEIALKLIEYRKSNFLFKNFKNFKNINHQEICLKLIENRCGEFVVSSLKDFKNINHQEIALKLIEVGDSSIVIRYLKSFKDLNQKVAIKLIEAGHGWYVINYLENFKNLNYQEIGLKLLETDINLFINNIEKFTNLDQEVALKLIEAGHGWYVINYLENFKNLNYQEIGLKLSEVDIYLFINNIEKFTNLDQEIALKLIETGHSGYMADYLANFNNLNQDIALKLIEARSGDIVVSNLETFKDINLSEIYLKLIEVGDWGYLYGNLLKFNLSPQNFYQAVKERYSDFITKVETKIPKLASQLAKSAELLIDILNIKYTFSEFEKNIAENPFLLEALEDNPRYGSRLILKYPSFDETSKNNIKELFNNEAEILKENPDIDKNSDTFRQLMQEKLVDYANNYDILDELENYGVDTDQWLYYEQETYFTLGESEDVKFSDQIKTPITRIKETLNKYQDSIINVLSGYKKELQESFIPNPESEELKQKIIELKQRIEAETDDKRIQGMQRGLTSLEAKEATLKPASIWSKVQSDIFRLKSMIDNIFKFHDACTTTETKIENTKDRKELIKEKDNLENNKTQLRDSFKEFELFFESYETKLKELIIPSLGQDRSDSLIQEIKEAIGEELNHYDTDKNTLKNIFNEKPENENKLNGREMKISISSRSTQDLYLGNYCPCCICIDSEYHGAESPIADYVTDLGMQNIVVYDEKTKAPVVACWTFVGENEKNGEPIMVIDNIEANTDYTSNYPGQLKEIISKYINDYAKSVNIKTIIQGLHNNDLEVFPLGSVGRKFGNNYNRADGYFLEAERNIHDGNDDEENDDNNEDDWGDEDEYEDNNFTDED